MAAFKIESLNYKQNILKMENNQSTTTPDIASNYQLPAVFLFGIKIIRYRIVKDRYNGFECQIWRIWFPFWLEMGWVNTHSTLEEAIDYITSTGVVLSS